MALDLEGTADHAVVVTAASKAFNIPGLKCAQIVTGDDATRDRLQRQREAGVLRDDVPVEVLTQFLELAYDGLVLHLATGRPPGELLRVLDLVEEAVRRG